MLSNELEKVLKSALQIALDHKHEYVTFEHLLLSLLNNEQVIRLFNKKNSDINVIKSRIEQYIRCNLTDLIDQSVVNPHPTAGFQRVIQRALLHAKAQGNSEVTSLDILAEFFYEHETFAVKCLKESGIARKDLVNSRFKELESPAKQDRIPHIDSEMLAKASFENTAENINDPIEQILEKYCLNLNTQAKNKKVDQLIGREQEINRTLEILCRRKKNNVIMVGEAGVGKTAIVEGMSHRIVAGDVPQYLQDKVIYALDLGAMLAGTKFRGEFESRVKELVEALSKSENAILFIDEIHSIVGAGSSVSGAMDASNLLKPALTKGLFRCIGATTFQEYRSHFEKDAALLRRFQKIVIEEPGEELTLEILRGLKSEYEQYHNVIYDEGAFEKAIQLSQRYIYDKKLPDKAIDLVDEAGARNNMQGENNKVTITGDHIEDILSSTTNISSIEIKEGELQTIKNLEKNLKKCIFGQDEAINTLCSSIRMVKAGLRRVAKPMGCYIFSGPTGVGKTELARQLAHFCHMKLLKFDMSECSESNSVSKLIGSSPGYVGSEKGGLLTEQVEKNPYSVILLDEIEKAHPEILNLLLQIMDDGQLTDNSGKRINFSNTIIILTTNLVGEHRSKSIGFESLSEQQISELKPDTKKLEAYFSPEFRSRLDNIILFNKIDKVSDKIIIKNLQELSIQLQDKAVDLQYEKSLVKYINEKCFAGKEGARNIAKIIDKEIKQPIADQILFGKLKNGGRIKIGVNSSKQIKFSFEKIIKDLDRFNAQFEAN